MTALKLAFAIKQEKKLNSNIYSYLFIMQSQLLKNHENHNKINRIVGNESIFKILPNLDDEAFLQKHFMANGC